jgi:hypothetical protein
LFVVGVCRAGDPTPIETVSYFRVETVEPLRLLFQSWLLARACSHRYTRLCPVRPESEKAYDEAIAGIRLMTGGGDARCRAQRARGDDREELAVR